MKRLICTNLNSIYTHIQYISLYIYTLIYRVWFVCASICPKQRQWPLQLAAAELELVGIKAHRIHDSSALAIGGHGLLTGRQQWRGAAKEPQGRGIAGATVGTSLHRHIRQVVPAAHGATVGARNRPGEGIEGLLLGEGTRVRKMGASTRNIHQTPLKILRPAFEGFSFAGLDLPQFREKRKRPSVFLPICSERRPQRPADGSKAWWSYQMPPLHPEDTAGPRAHHPVAN